MQLFYSPDINSPLHTLSPEESRHAVKVLRLGAGDGLHLVDGRGNMMAAEVVNPDPRECLVRITESIPEYGKRPCRLVVGVAPTKNSDRYEWFLEKATEVGVDAFVPLECSNSERRVFKPGRAEKIVVSAMKQSLKAYLPALEALTPVREVIGRPFDGIRLIAHCRPAEEFPDAPPVPVTDTLVAGVDTLVLIGPEGDFTAEEVALALKNGFVPVSLGPSRLRTETAALTAVIAVYLKNSQPGVCNW